MRDHFTHTEADAAEFERHNGPSYPEDRDYDDTPISYTGPISEFVREIFAAEFGHLTTPTDDIPF